MLRKCPDWLTLTNHTMAKCQVQAMLGTVFGFDVTAPHALTS